MSVNTLRMSSQTLLFTSWALISFFRFFRSTWKRALPLHAGGKPLRDFCSFVAAFRLKSHDCIWLHRLHSHSIRFGFIFYIVCLHNTAFALVYWHLWHCWNSTNSVKFEVSNFDHFFDQRNYARIANDYWWGIILGMQLSRSPPFPYFPPLLRLYDYVKIYLNSFSNPRVHHKNWSRVVSFPNCRVAETQLTQHNGMSILGTPLIVSPPPPLLTHSHIYISSV